MSEYSKVYYCSNCERTYKWYFQFGTIAHQPDCPHCGVNPEDLKNEKPVERFAKTNTKESL